MGESILDDDVLVDSLVVDVIDGLREDLHPQFGVRPYRVWVVRRKWSGRRLGEGSSIDQEIELRPQPRIAVWDGFRFRMEPCGLDEMGEIRLTEVSLTMTHDELTGGEMGMAEQILYKVGEAHGQGQPDRYFTIAAPPFVDREKDMGWILRLKHVAGSP